MSEPAESDFPIPVWEPPPVRRGWPRTAWCVIGLAVLRIASAPFFQQPKEAASVDKQHDARQLMVLRLEGKFAVGAYNFGGRTDQQYYQHHLRYGSGLPYQVKNLSANEGSKNGSKGRRCGGHDDGPQDT